MRFFILIYFLFCTCPTLAQSTIKVGNFSGGDLQEWKAQKFVGETLYRLEENEGHRLLHALAQSSASGLCREVEIDLAKTPILRWSWRMDKGKENLNERTKEGDDHPLRLYLIHKYNFFQATALQYAWSLSERENTAWLSPYTTNMMQLAVNSGTKQAGSLLNHTRNVRADFADFLHERIEQIDEICIMSDADNSRSLADAWYGDIEFSS